MKIVDCIQGDGVWLAARSGRITASEVADAVSVLKVRRGDKQVGDSSGTRDAYKASLVAEILSGRASETYVSDWMKRGNYQEPFARAFYENRFDVMVDTVGFVIHDTIDRSGSSPDGLIGDNGGLEIKVPKIENHFKYMFAGILPPEYEPQVQFNMACTGRQWWDFVSYSPKEDGLPDRYRLFHKRVYRDDKRIADLEDGVLKCLAEVDDMIARLEELNPYIAPAPQEDPPDEFAGCLLTDEEIGYIK